MYYSFLKKIDSKKEDVAQPSSERDIPDKEERSEYNVEYYIYKDVYVVIYIYQSVYVYTVHIYVCVSVYLCMCVCVFTMWL